VGVRWQMRAPEFAFHPHPHKGEGAESFAALGGCNSAFPLCKRGTEGDFAALALRTTAHGPGAGGSNRGRVGRELQIQVHPRQRHQRRELLQKNSLMFLPARLIVQRVEPECERQAKIGDDDKPVEGG
jgi:hypothetical protein